MNPEIFQLSGIHLMISDVWACSSFLKNADEFRGFDQICQAINSYIFLYNLFIRVKYLSIVGLKKAFNLF